MNVCGWKIEPAQVPVLFCIGDALFLDDGEDTYVYDKDAEKWDRSFLSRFNLPTLEKEIAE